MRIGEVAVISPQEDNTNIFIKSICTDVQNSNDNISIGRLKINEQLMLHFYGITIEKDVNSISWHLLSTKVLGFVVIFNWDNENSLEKITKILNFFSANYTTPLIIVANINDKNNIPLPFNVFEAKGINIESKSRFFFSEISNPSDSKKIITTIIDILLE